MNAYLYFYAVCGAVAIGMIFAAAVDFCMKNGGRMDLRRKHGMVIRRGIPQWRKGSTKQSSCIKKIWIDNQILRQFVSS